jgi:hypothetical protein
VPQWHTQLLKVGLGQLRENINVDLILAECRFILTEAKVSEPRTDINDRALAGHGS